MRHHRIVSTLLPATLFVSACCSVQFETPRPRPPNLDLSYGLYRLDDADESLVHCQRRHGSNVNGDDGELNYNAGLVSNMVRHCRTHCRIAKTSGSMYAVPRSKIGCRTNDSTAGD